MAAPQRGLTESPWGRFAVTHKAGGWEITDYFANRPLPIEDPALTSAAARLHSYRAITPVARYGAQGECVCAGD